MVPTTAEPQAAQQSTAAAVALRDQWSSCVYSAFDQLGSVPAVTRAESAFVACATEEQAFAALAGVVIGQLAPTTVARVKLSLKQELAREQNPFWVGLELNCAVAATDDEASGKALIKVEKTSVAIRVPATKTVHRETISNVDARQLTLGSGGFLLKGPNRSSKYVGMVDIVKGSFIVECDRVR